MVDGHPTMSVKYMDKDIFVQLFTSRVRPILEYGNVIWSPRLIRDIDAVERVQRRATKTVPGISTKTYPDRLHTLKLGFHRYGCDMQMRMRLAAASSGMRFV